MSSSRCMIRRQHPLVHLASSTDKKRHGANGEKILPSARVREGRGPYQLWAMVRTPAKLAMMGISPDYDGLVLSKLSVPTTCRCTSSLHHAGLAGRRDASARAPTLGHPARFNPGAGSGSNRASAQAVPPLLLSLGLWSLASVAARSSRTRQTDRQSWCPLARRRTPYRDRRPTLRASRCADLLNLRHLLAAPDPDYTGFGTRVRRASARRGVGEPVEVREALVIAVHSIDDPEDRRATSTSIRLPR